MEKLTIEQKAQKYDEAIKRAKGAHNSAKSDKENGVTDKITEYTIQLTETIFPELKESDDEKLREQVVYAINQLHVCECTKNKLLAWLEKQGEKKSIWHNEDEEPKKDSLILLIMQSGTPIVAKIIEPNHTFNHGERWAYIDDLLENQDEQKPAKGIEKMNRT